MAKPTTTGEGQSIEQLQERYNKLNTKKITAEADLKNAETQLASLRREAMEKHKTDDLDELRKMLETMKTENETKRREYEVKLDQIESDLRDVEQKFADVEVLGGK